MKIYTSSWSVHRVRGLCSSSTCLFMYVNLLQNMALNTLLQVLNFPRSILVPLLLCFCFFFNHMDLDVCFVSKNHHFGYLLGHYMLDGL